jgi:hypothetical protein
MDLNQWLKGLLAALIGAAANGVLVVVANPGTFDIYSTAGWKNISTVCGATALVAGAAYLKQSPLPTTKTETVTVTKETTTPSVPPKV